MIGFQQGSIELRIAETISRALGLPPAAAPAPLRMGSTPGWDSMGHMAVVLELEREFGKSFPSYRLPDLVDVPSIAKAIQESEIQ